MHEIHLIELDAIRLDFWGSLVAFFDESFLRESLAALHHMSLTFVNLKRPNVTPTTSKHRSRVLTISIVLSTGSQEETHISPSLCGCNSDFRVIEVLTSICTLRCGAGLRVKLHDLNVGFSVFWRSEIAKLQF